MWDVTPCSVSEFEGHFGGICYLQVCSTPQGCKQKVLVKRHSASTKLHALNILQDCILHSCHCEDFVCHMDVHNIAS